MGDDRRRSRYTPSPSPRRNRSPSRSPPPVAKDDRDDAANPGNNLYITGLSTRVMEKDLQDHLSREGKVLECRIVVDPRTRESRGFGFVTMASADDADRCIKRLNRSTLEGRIITIEKAKRKRARTPTPGEYLGVRAPPRTRAPSYTSSRYKERERDRDYHRRSPRYSPYRGGSRDRSPAPHSPGRDRSYRRERSRSPHYSRRSYSPYRR